MFIFKGSKVTNPIFVSTDNLLRYFKCLDELSNQYFH